ncbi:type VI secretion system tip protein VgrG [Pusillimonas sp. DMV24BSW_D]|uniref:type VI secretion system Vgr family protein n=1 Tax=Neopusillimonas aestuarii TaxID=2716226 RepID=UPI00140BE346|nr:type VI secretion system tip protein TssI/VgrG [Pusillimonas sp. DMV24BSW_D]QIM48539.1 type VI secretion system tip protein VgrG [Pusillimonas sp. DMV24BSW_D]
MASNAEKELLFTFELSRKDLPTFDVVRFTGNEAVSALFEFDIVLVSTEGNVDLDNVLNATATLHIWARDHARSTPYHGMIARFEQEGQVDDYYFYRATLVPRLWKLGLTFLNDVYLNENRIPDIIRSILDRNSLKGPDIKLALKNENDYRQRSFICQYQETDFNFVSRWMEHEGIYYFFDHDDNASVGEVLNMVDYKEAQPEKTISLRYTPPENVQTDRQDNCVTAFTCRKTHIPGNVLVQDFNFRKASLGDNLKSEQAVSGGKSGHYMYYGDNLRTEPDAERLAKIRSEELACKGTTYHGSAPAAGVRSGYFLEVTHHYRDSYNGKYWVTSVQHQGSQTGVILAGQNTAYNDNEQGALYECQFTALEASQQFRPERTTPKPVIAGILNAVIDAEGEGDHAELNEYGQYKVQLLYDYSAKSANKGSSWLRMATPYAGKNNGMHFPLLKGTEVLISFVGGDPDQPIIVGAVPNSENPNVVRDANAACNGVRTSRGNVLNMVDKPGSEVVSLFSPAKGSCVYIGTFPLIGADVSLGTPNPADVLKNIS